jgi:hypothetical protein
MKVNPPAAAAPIPPETGESTYVILCFYEFLLSSIAVYGEIVEQSIIKESLILK